MRRLPLVKIVWGAFSLPWMHRGEWLRAIRYPLIGFFSLLLLWYLMDDLTEVVPLALWYAAYFFVTSWLAVCSHRVVLVDAHEPWSWPDAAQMRIVSVYVASLALLWLMWFALTALLGLTVAALGLIADSNISGVANTPPGGLEPDPGMQTMIDWIMVLASLPATYLVARLSPLLPAVALEQRWSLRNAWDLSHGNGWRLAVVVIVPPYLFGLAVDAATRDGASAAEIIVLSLAAALLISLEVVALSLSFRELEPPAPPPTVPPV